MDRAIIKKELEVHSPLPKLDVPLCDMWRFLNDKMKHFPAKTALIDPLESRTVTYSELCDVSKTIALNLLADGFNVAKPMVVFLPNCVDFVFIILAVWRIGGKCVLISPMVQGSLSRQLNQLDIEYIICSTDNIEHVAETKNLMNLKVICTGDFQDCLKFSDFCEPNRKGNLDLEDKEVDPFSTALIGFSTGSSGLPKAMELSHMSLVEKAHSYSYCLDMENAGDDFHIVYQPMGHLWTVLLVFSCHMSYGKSNVIMQHQDTDEYFKLLNKYKVKRLYVNPAVIVSMVKSKIVEKYDMSHIQHIHTSTAPLSTEIAKQLKKLIGTKVQITTAFGTTEVLTCLARPYSIDDDKYKCNPESVGWPISNVQAKVIDCNNGECVGPNTNGEICIKCKYPFKGYIGNQEATLEVLDKNGWYHTGDLGYYDEKGAFFTVDRIKEMIKVSGVPVSVAGIEAVLTSHPSVLDAAVTSVPDTEQGELPYAWVIIKTGTNVTEKELQDYMKGKISKCATLHGGVRFVESIPKAANGKILRKVLKEEMALFLKKDN